MVPAIGPLALGHALVIPYRHGRGLLHEPALIKKDHNEFVSLVREKVASRGLGLLTIEHGGANASGRGACITHTHVHLLPGMQTLLSAFDDLASLSDTPQGPYFQLSNGYSTILKDASSMPGQAMRRRIGRLTANERWDWAAFPNPELVLQTVEWWKGLV